MSDKRQKLLKNLTEKLTQTIRNMHRGQTFPYGGLFLKRQQIMILFFINENQGAVSVKEIAKFLQVTPGAVTQFVDELVKKKLVERTESLLDRRSINIKLTAAAKKRFNKFKEDYAVMASRAFSNLSDRELKKFVELLEKINRK